MHWSVSPATYARMKLHFPSRALRAEPSWRRQSRQRSPMQNLTALVGSSMLLYLTKHDRRGSRRRPLSPATNLENLSRALFFFSFLSFFFLSLDIVSLITYSYYGRPVLMSVCFFGSPPTLSSIVRQHCILCFWQINTLSLSGRPWKRQVYVSFP